MSGHCHIVHAGMLSALFVGVSNICLCTSHFSGPASHNQFVGLTPLGYSVSPTLPLKGPSGMALTLLQ